MQPLDEKITLSPFMNRLMRSNSSTLLLDYDSALAPVHSRADHLSLYSEILCLLEGISKCKKSRVVIITGKTIADIDHHFKPLKNFEIWGSHSLEYRSARGDYKLVSVSSGAESLLSRVKSWLNATGLLSKVELKPGAIVARWLEVSNMDIEKIDLFIRKLGEFADQDGLKLFEFEGGLELRLSHPNKADAVIATLCDADIDAQIAYLGEDLANESATHFLNSKGLNILVSSKYQKTDASIWLQSPKEVAAFLAQWLNSVSARIE